MAEWIVFVEETRVTQVKVEADDIVSALQKGEDAYRQRKGIVLRSKPEINAHNAVNLNGPTR